MPQTFSKALENAGNEAVKKLRLDNLSKGYPFMINSNDLPDRHCYYEYPDGSIKLMELSENAKEFMLIRLLSETEGDKIRKRFGLIRFYA